MLFPVHIKMAFSSLKAAKWRSLLTMLGVVIGVASVVTIVSISEGVKRQLITQTYQAGGTLITIRPGRQVDSGASNSISNNNLAASFGSITFSQTDFDAVAKTPGLDSVSSFSLVNGIPNINDRTFDHGFTVATTDNALNVLNLKLAYGTFFSDTDKVQDGAVIGRHVAEQLFQESIPIGQEFTIRGQSFRVRGVLAGAIASPLVPYSDYDNAVFIPAAAGKKLSGGAANIYQIIVKSKANNLSLAAESITKNLQQAHAGQQDFTVLKGTEAYATANGVLAILTKFVAGIATISLIVGGIGIMNIMLVSVSERTREIGVRKAVGATNRQILLQFMTEALVLSVGGGIIGVVVSFIANYFLRIFTSLQPAISWPIIGVATVVAVAVGVIFGIAPAAAAARKDPIDALRYN